MSREHSVLVIEDDANDVLFIRRALKKAGIACAQHLVSDGDSALEYLEGRGQYADRTAFPLPTLVLLDLKLPRRSGLEVLEAIQHHPLRSRMVVVVLTSSRQAGDVDRAYALGANSYLVKPISPASLGELVGALGLYWLGKNEPAPHP